MKGFILFLLLVIGSFAMAEEVPAGHVRVLNSRPAQYDVRTKKLIPNSMHTILKVDSVYQSNKTLAVIVLLISKNNSYDALVVNFDRFREKDIVASRFRAALEKGFIMDVSAKDLTFESSNFLSLLIVDANNIDTLRQGSNVTAIKKCSQKNVHAWNTWTSDIQLNNNCL